MTGELSYPAALEALTARGRFGIRLGLARVRALLRLLGDPQDDVRGALVAGTNGKGSVLALGSAALRAAGHRVGETPKPHLVTYRERLQVDGRPVDPATFARLVSTVLPLADRVARRYGEATEFELLTAVVFAWFAEAGLDLALVEVGLGGRLDATHAWDGGVAVVTNVDLDHMDRLGPTVRHIAREKAAIIERGDRAVTGATGDGLAVIRRRARRVGVPLVEAPPARILGWDRDGLEVDLGSLGPTRVGLRGRHQAANVAVADAMLDELEAAGIATTPPDARRRGYASARWPGRLELVEVPSRGGAIEVILDGAHNPAGAAALADALDDLAPFLRGAGDRPATLVMGVMADKDVDGIVGALARARPLDGARIVCTRVEGARAMSAEALAATWARLAPTTMQQVEPEVARALDRGLAWAAEIDGPVVVAGSLYLVGAVRARIVDDPDLVRSAGEGGPMTDDAAERRLPGEGTAIPARPDRGGGAATPSFALPAGAGSGVPGRLAPIRLHGREFAWGARTFVVGILNVTPDSFSGDGLLGRDGGPTDEAVAAAVALGRRMVEDGADILDIGGESTRPGHADVAAGEERDRVVPIIAALRAALPDTPISVDTVKPSVAQAALAAGADLVNDVWATAPDDALARVAAAAGAPLVVMHNRSEARYRSVVGEVIADLAAAIERAVTAGVAWDRIIVDPGFGFGKTPAQNLALLRDLGSLRVLGRPILLGTSRKSTLGKVLDLPADERLEATLATTALAVAAGVDLVRVHDVRENVRVARMADAIVRASDTLEEAAR